MPPRSYDFTTLPGTFGRDLSSDWFPWPFEAPGTETIRIKIRRGDDEKFVAWTQSLDPDGVIKKASARAGKKVQIEQVMGGIRKKKQKGKEKPDPKIEEERTLETFATALQAGLEEQPDEAFAQLGDPHLPALGVGLYRIEEIEGLPDDSLGYRLALCGFSGVIIPARHALNDTDAPSVLTLAQLAAKPAEFRSTVAADPNVETVSAAAYPDGSPIVITAGEYAGKSLPQALQTYVVKCAEELQERRESLFEQVESDSPGSAASSAASLAD